MYQITFDLIGIFDSVISKSDGKQCQNHGKNLKDMLHSANSDCVFTKITFSSFPLPSSLKNRHRCTLEKISHFFWKGKHEEFWMICFSCYSHNLQRLNRQKKTIGNAVVAKWKLSEIKWKESWKTGVLYSL